ncbi:hypothetical protein FQN50_001970 [Emmonsiellopsis sp. PD_5]|nr:hypothetical protein FQN50_001970 [Emmonsiellopsis sp. PD_5]
MQPIRAGIPRGRGLTDSYRFVGSGPNRDLSPQPVSHFLSVLRIFWDIVVSLERTSTEASPDLRMFYIHLDTYLFLVESVSPIQHAAGGAELESLAHPILEKLASFLPSSVIPDYETKLASGHPFPRLAALEYFWGLPEPREEKIVHVQQCLDFGSPETRDDVLLLLRDYVSRLRSHFPEATENESEEHRALRKKKRKPTSSVWGAANTVFQALAISSKACSLSHSHEYAVRLRITTHRQPAEDRYSFEAFVTPNMAECFWQEAQIQVMLTSPAPKEQLGLGVRFALPEDHRVNKPRRPRGRLAVKRLCEQIQKIQSKPLMRLNLAVENNNLWKDQSSRSNLSISRSAPPLTLEEIIKFRPDILTEKLKRVLAVLLAYSVLHFRGTPWLQPAYFNAANIIFFRTATTIPLKPYIHAGLNEVNHNATEDTRKLGDLDSETDPDDQPLHPYPDIMMLGVMLMELYLVRPFQSLAASAGVELEDRDNMDDNTRYVVAVEIFERSKSEFSDNYREAVDACLTATLGLDHNAEKLDEEALKPLIYDRIVQSLEDELDQGFGNTIPIENLDEVAQALDLSSWERVRSSQQCFLGPIENSRPLYDGPKGREDTSVPLPDTYPSPVSKVLNDDRDYRLRTSSEEIHRSLRDNGCEYSLPTLDHQSYTVGWICALAEEELAPAQAMLDEVHPSLPQDTSDRNTYTLGRMGVHNVVMACLPSGVKGTISAARVANDMLSTFKSLRFGLMVGIGGGVPGAADIRLGDIVVGEPKGSFGSIIQYDFGTAVKDDNFVRTGSLNRPPDVLLTAVSRLKADHYRGQRKLENYLEEMARRYPELSAECSHPGEKHDLLYDYEYGHHPSNNEGSCEKCDLTKLVQRMPRKSNSPRIHYGLIASGNKVMRDVATRERLRRDLGVLCFEMEAAGLADALPSLVIRGVCDYSDSHKNKKWQGYAATVAAAYAKELLGVISSC